MQNEDRLKLQAWLDGELPVREASRVSNWVESNPEARELAKELRNVKVIMETGEVPLVMEDSREFYWNQIARRIDATEAVVHQPEAVHASSWMQWCRQWLVPVGGLAAIVVMISNVGTQPGEFQAPASDVGEDVHPSTQPIVAPRIPPAVEPSFAEPVINSEGEVSAEDVNVLNLNIPTDGNPNLQPRSERTIPSIENPER